MSLGKKYVLPEKNSHGVPLFFSGGGAALELGTAMAFFEEYQQPQNKRYIYELRKVLFSKNSRHLLFFLILKKFGNKYTFKRDISFYH